MATLQKTVEIIFGGKNEVSKTIGAIEKDFNVLNSAVTSVTAPLAKAGDAVLKMDAALMALAIGGMAYAIKQSADFNQSFALISTSITATGGNLDKYRTDVLNYSTTSVKSIADINASLYTAAQAGIKYSESLEFIRAAEQLAVANKANLNTTVDLLTGTMNAYGFTVQDVGKLNDVFFQSTLIGKQTIDELGTSMGQVVGIAANAGVSFEELNAAIATLTAKGMNTETAITAVKNVITTLVSPSKEAAGAAQALGLNFSLAELTSKGFSGMLTEIMAKTGGSKEKMVELFSEIRAMNGVLSLTGDGMKFFNKALDETKNSAGNAEAAYQKMVVTFSNQMQMVKNVAEVTMIDIGTKLEPMAAKLAGSFGDLFKGIKIGVDSGAFDPLFAYLEQVAGSLSTWFSGIAAAMPEAFSKLDFAKLIEAFNELGRAISGYLGGLDLTKADDLAGAMQTIIDIITGIVNITAGMADAFRPFASVIVDFFKSLADGGPETQETTGKILAFSMAIQDAGLAVVAAILAIDEFKVSVSGLFNTLAGGVQVLWNGFEILLTAIKGMVIVIGGLFVGLLDKLTFGLLPGLDSMKAKLTEWGSTIGPSFEKNGAEAAAGLSRLTSGLAQLGAESGTTKEKTKKLHAELSGIPESVTTAIKLIGAEAVASSAKDVKTDIAKEIPEKWQTMVEVLADGTSISAADGMIKKTFPDGTTYYTNLGVTTDDASIAAAKKKIDAAAPNKKEIEATLKYDEARIKAQSEIIGKSLEWKAKVDIAQAEAAAEGIKAAFSSVSTGITSTGDLIGSLFSTMKSGSADAWEIEEQVRKENERRGQEFALQARLTNAQIENIEARTKAMEKGDAMIKISADGLKPQLEAFMWAVLEAVQIRANESGSEFLLGMKSV